MGQQFKKIIIFIATDERYTVEPVNQDTWKMRTPYLQSQMIVNSPGKSGHLNDQDTVGWSQGVLNTQVPLYSYSLQISSIKKKIL